jgi:uncharacterized protein YegP (UPF0339 family)
MARYIDAEKVIEKISHITVTVMGGRSCEKTIFGKALNSYREEVLKRIEDAPTADVVPKSKVDGFPCVAYNKKHERYQVIHKGKDGRIFASKLYYTRKDAEKALAELKKKYTEAEE